MQSAIDGGAFKSEPPEDRAQLHPFKSGARPLPLTEQLDSRSYIITTLQTIPAQLTGQVASERRL